MARTFLHPWRCARVVVALTLATGACADPIPPPPPAVDGSAPDLGADAGADLGVPSPDLGPCPDQVPAGPYGIGADDSLEPFHFDRCDEEPGELYGAAHCEARATVVNFAAGWCEPCFQETSDLQLEIAERYGDAVRVIQVLFEDAAFGEVDPSECRTWVERFATVDLETLMATSVEVGPYLVRSSVPTTFVVDSSGRIRLAIDGAEPGLPEVRAAIDQILAE